MSLVARNLKVGYILAFMGELYLPIAVWFFFYSRYLTIQQIAILTGIQVVAWSLFEVPTGAFADLFGRRNAIFLAFLLYASAMFIAAFNTLFWVFCVLEVVKGISNALNSGSLEALLFDTLKEQGQAKRWDKVVANIETLLWVGLFMASILGGFLFYFWYPLPYLLQGLIYSLAMFLTLLLIEPKIAPVKHNLKATLAQNLQGFKELFANPRTTHLTLILAIIGTGYIIAYSLLGIAQAEEYGLDSRGVGILFGVGYILSALASQAFPKLKSIFGSKKIVIGTAIILLSSFLIANFVGVVAGSMLIVMRIASSTTFRNVRSGLINNIFSSKNRATSLSAMQLLTQLPYAIFAYFIGGYIDTHSPNQFALLLGVILLLALGFTQLIFSKKQPLALNQ